MPDAAALPPIRIDLGSDTSTRPSPGMRAAMASAPVGDEQMGEDPTTCALEARVAALLGQEQAMFLPSGTMCNQIALLVHCRPGDEIIAAHQAHIYGSEGAGAAALAGAFVRPIEAPEGIFDGAAVRSALRPLRARAPRSRVVVVEQTANRGGGAVWPLAAVADVADRAHEHGLAVHMDGARLLNAVVASGIAAQSFGRLCDSVWLDLTKGLGCPVGAVLAGPRDFITAAWTWKHRLGGAMRQSGILAAAGLYALDHNIERLAHDHAQARRLADLVVQIPGVTLRFPKVETNIVFIDLADTGCAAPAVLHALRAEGIRLSVEGPHLLRAVTHLDIGAADIAPTADALSAAVRRLSSAD
ncbi:threonine aldolase family protein [Aquabacter spiritensis]|uniref:L-threonine aldolase n=1 Tax=Aquabacter spiritensis TaxID=933073 RepID=A0A4R3M133_9HYPH|nr:GntG family PLP-dependent aldolase [Aquabacter spiritensis]TCT06770.1 L-threonine aldolase [Aquabacter spiritensis]